MPRMDGAAAIRAMQAAGLPTPVIVLTTFDDHEQVLACIRAGARGYLLKDVSLDDLIRAIQSVHRGETMIQPAVTETLLRGLGEQDSAFEASSMPEPLTPRETEVVRLMARGMSNKDICTALVIGEKTVKTHVSSILSKLGVPSRTQAALYAVRIGLVSDREVGQMHD